MLKVDLVIENKNQELEDKAYEYVAKGISLWRSDDLDMAIDNYQKAVDILRSRTDGIWSVDDSNIIEALGHIFRAKGSYDKAIKCYEDAWGENHLLIGDVYYDNLKDYNKASLIYLSLLNLSADSCYASAALNLSAMAWKGLGIQKSLIDALKWMTIAMSMNPNISALQNTIRQLKNEMTPQEIESAELLTIKWIKDRDVEIYKLRKIDPWSHVGF